MVIPRKSPFGSFVEKRAFGVCFSAIIHWNNALDAYKQLQSAGEFDSCFSSRVAFSSEPYAMRTLLQPCWAGGNPISKAKCRGAQMPSTVQPESRHDCWGQSIWAGGDGKSARWTSWLTYRLVACHLHCSNRSVSR